MEPPDPMVIGVYQPSLSHSSFVRKFISSSPGVSEMGRGEMVKKQDAALTDHYFYA